MTRIDVLIADDHAIVREGLLLVLGSEPDMRVVGQAEDGQTAVDLAASLAPHVVLLDMRMAGLGGVAAIGRLRASCPDVRVLVLSMNEDLRYVRSALAAGAAGYVAKRSGTPTLLSALRAVAAGDTFVDPALPTHPAPGDGHQLSAREAEVARLVAAGHTSRAIGAQLGISKSSVETYRVRVLNKLGVDSRAELIERLRSDGAFAGATA